MGSEGGDTPQAWGRGQAQDVRLTRQVLLCVVFFTVATLCHPRGLWTRACKYYEQQNPETRCVSAPQGTSQPT